MADTTAEYKDKAAKGADEAEKKVEEGVEAVEHSKYGQKIPTHIEKIEFREIVFGTIFMVGVLIIPVYLLISIDAKIETKGLFSFAKNFVKWSIIIAGFIGLAFDVVMIMSKKTLLLKVSMVLKLWKAVACLLMIIFISNLRGLNRLLLIVYLCGVIMVDALFIYYTVIYFKRINSDDYDDKGTPKKSNQKNDI
ncbi:hypothetical protein COBT_001589 [Conglomerata obtusa]